LNGNFSKTKEHVIFTAPESGCPYSDLLDDLRTVLLSSSLSTGTFFRNICKCIRSSPCLHTACGDLCSGRRDGGHTGLMSAVALTESDDHNTHNNNISAAFFLLSPTEYRMII
jgi:hypothetical protein